MAYLLLSSIQSDRLMRLIQFDLRKKEWKYQQNEMRFTRNYPERSES